MGTFGRHDSVHHEAEPLGFPDGLGMGMGERNHLRRATGLLTRDMNERWSHLSRQQAPGRHRVGGISSSLRDVLSLKTLESAQVGVAGMASCPSLGWRA